MRSFRNWAFSTADANKAWQGLALALSHHRKVSFQRRNHHESHRVLPPPLLRLRSDSHIVKLSPPPPPNSVRQVCLFRVSVEVGWRWADLSVRPLLSDRAASAQHSCNSLLSFCFCFVSLQTFLCFFSPFQFFFSAPMITSHRREKTISSLPPRQ